MQEFFQKKSKKNFTAIIINNLNESDYQEKNLEHYSYKLANSTIIEHVLNNIQNAGGENIFCIFPQECQNIKQYHQKNIHSLVDKNVNIKNLFLKKTTNIFDFYQSYLEKKNLHTTEILIFYALMPMMQTQTITDIAIKIKKFPYLLALDYKKQIVVIAADIHKLRQIAGEQNIFEKNNLASILEKNHDKYILQIEKQYTLQIKSAQKLAECENIIQNQLRQKFLKQGITMTLPQTVFLSADTKIKQQTHIEPYVVFGKNVKIGEKCTIKSFSYLEGADIGGNSTIGPYARIRSNTITGNNVKIGNFVEIKNTYLADKVKANHLAYLGDAFIGAETNIGAGTVICNYDGEKKHQTIIEENVFVGSNTSLIAPLKIKKQAKIAAGSVITKDVQEKTLAISRAETKTKIIKKTVNKDNNKR